MSVGPRFRIAFSLLVFFGLMAWGAIRYRGPSVLGVDADLERPAAGRMRATLERLLGEPAEMHRTGTPAGEAFLERLKQTIESFGIETRQIDLEWTQPHEESGQPLMNLLAVVPGMEPALKPIFIATHHDSCRWGPGAGDAGSAVVALVESIRIAARTQPRRTTYFLFTDGEEFGLQGAKAIARMKPLPLPTPIFALNFDARGTSGGVPMFQTHPGNLDWTRRLIGHLADPPITSSLAVTVYRTLPNATDFDVWSEELGWPGFNFATIGGAHHYHRPSDTPENLSDRTLQHMGDHVHRMRMALDRLDGAVVSEDPTGSPGNAVFFDVLGLRVFCYSERSQRFLGVLMILLFVLAGYKRGVGAALSPFVRLGIGGLVAITVGFCIGCLMVVLLKTTPWANLRYTPVDYWVGCLTIVVAMICVTTIAQRYAEHWFANHAECMCDSIWILTGLLSVVMVIWLPGGAYLLMIPSITYATARLMQPSATIASAAGWMVTCVLVCPLLILLIQALGPWTQWLYAVLSGMLAIQASSVWGRGHRRATEGLPTKIAEPTTESPVSAD